MSFIVKGKKIPNTCWDCPLADVEQGWCDSDMVTIIDFNERPVECPLVALPDKHGRLVDADEMLNRLQAWNTSDRMDKALYNFTWHRIMEQPTIVESEDSE